MQDNYVTMQDNYVYESSQNSKKKFRVVRLTKCKFQCSINFKNFKFSGPKFLENYEIRNFR